MHNVKIFKCYGTYNSTECKINRKVCDKLKSCFKDSNEQLGVCVCIYKLNCLYTKQIERMAQHNIEDNVEECPHYILKENLKSD